MPSASQLPLFPETEGKPEQALFLALFPDPATEARLESLALRLRKELGLQGHPLGPERYHITLQYFGGFSEWPNPTMEAVLHAVAGLALPRFEIELDRAASFRGGQGNHPFVLQGGDGLAGVHSLYRALGDALARQGVATKASFSPHLTLLYDALDVAEQTIEPIRWTAQEFSLIRRVPNAKPVSADAKFEGYQRLATWALHD